jgi:hypothetical protein
MALSSTSVDGDGKLRTTAIKEIAIMKRVCLKNMATAIYSMRM